MEWIIIFAILLIIAFIFVKQALVKDNSYRVKGPLFTAAERSFLGVLDNAISDEYRVFGKVRVADILSPANGMDRKNWQISFNKISAKHFDYVLCAKDTLAVIAAVELDDKSHNSKMAKKRDAFLESACKSAELTLIRFRAKSGYQVQSVREQVERALH